MTLTALQRIPPRRYRLEDYARWFPKTGAIFLRYLKRSELLPPPPQDGRGRVGVVVMPWVSTPVAWYAMMLGLGLAHRGREVVFIWDDGGFPERAVQGQNQAIGTVLGWIDRYFPVVALSHLPGIRDGADSRDAALLDGLTDQNVTWILRGGDRTGHDAVIDRIKRSLTATLPLVRSALDQVDVDLLVVPGGVYGTSGLFLHEAKVRGCRVTTFDTDRRIAQICVDGVAAQNQDIPAAFARLIQEGPDACRQAVDIAKDEFVSRSILKDDYGFQVQASSSEKDDESCVLIPLNVEWDTAALGRHTCFEDTVDWLVSTISVALAEGGGPVVVRQHPSERRPLQRSRFDVAALLDARFGSDPRFRFVAADDPVSSYDLLRSARLVLPYVSTIGIEAAALGKPVLISGSCYYSDLGFVWSAGSREEYLRLLRLGLQDELPLKPEQAERAWLCYYLTAVRNRLLTDFTPHPDDFWTWCKVPPRQVLSDPVVAEILEAIDTGVPVAHLRHARLSGAGNAQAPRDLAPLNRASADTYDRLGLTDLR